MDEDFTAAVQRGLKLSKRVYFGKPQVGPHSQLMARSSPEVSELVPTAPMVYAVILHPEIVDNPDLPSYQPYVHGRCDPPALIPLQMKEVGMEIESYMDVALVTLRGRWRVHCVMGSKSCDCRVVIPMGEQGSILGVEADVGGRSYSTQVIQPEGDHNEEKVSKLEDGGFLKPQFFSFTVPLVDGGSEIYLNVSWSQKLSYMHGQFSITIPFKFPEYVTPITKILPKREKILFNVNTAADKEVLCQDPNHPLKVFKKEVIFVVDISGSMRENPLEMVKKVLYKALLELTPGDYFDIIAFNEDMHLFSSSLELATKEAVEEANLWISKNLVSEDEAHITKLLLSESLNKAISLLSNSRELLPHIFLITDGCVEDERNICNSMRVHVTTHLHISPRISTFGIGSYCNHYFLRLLASISRGLYGAAHDPDSIEVEMQRWLRRASLPITANIEVEVFDRLDAFEMYPQRIPDLSIGCPQIVFGRYQGKLPDSIKVKGILANLNDIDIDLKVQKTDIPLERIFAKQHIDQLTAQAWFFESKQLEEKVIKLSLQCRIPSEHTYLVLRQTRPTIQEMMAKKPKKANVEKLEAAKDRYLSRGTRIGFGDLLATAENYSVMFGNPKSPEASSVYMVTDCCSDLCDCACCRCCINFCSKLNDQFVVLMAQLCAGIACLACFQCCSLCCNGSD
ncbi:inter-alpha-trypsin inhibitor heavy chain H3 isoform X2 [Dioscorea cayenensis subsp. rotundata]|uniref:Inter-alpha-trypsin inhibitor heavy chain H3 isoform X2 n=1 Tax=Dioscorea cayennensis subsp. rotundata TaxID=55577 RepID=A0AB40BIE0_DIOCR|nr:inter-alpha-trypsin inhibitor heavy chain H3 isoform X2 [Dioscorea cayenensis subsp. rotundata]